MVWKRAKFSRLQYFPTVLNNSAIKILIVLKFQKQSNLFSIDGDNYGHNEENFRYILFDKEKREGFVADGPDGTRFTDDMLGALPFGLVGLGMIIT
ncbi:MAG: hypothetical protein LBJ60_07895 [Tannerellaceae bacterium]|jgi:hypothetical protein|nr:hypothetical protein [Tannerellaceae bacterium]